MSACCIFYQSSIFGIGEMIQGILNFKSSETDKKKWLERANTLSYGGVLIAVYKYT